MIILLSLLILFIISTMYKRYFPILGVRHIPNHITNATKDTLIIDIRDYNSSTGYEKVKTINIPEPYLKRQYSTLSHKDVYVLGSDRVGINLSIRFLTKKGFHVNGYILVQNNKLTTRQIWRECS